MIKLNLFILVSLFLSFVNQGYSQIHNLSILPAHAHNDYRHERPLFDALDGTFKSIEVDVFAIGDSLFVAHDMEDVKPGRTFRQLYLDPLNEIVNKNNGSVYGTDEELILLVDFKSEGIKTYKILHNILIEYKEILSHSFSGLKQKGAIQIIVSGNRPLEYMQKQELRLASYDGRIDELNLDISTSLMPLISDNWSNHFKWYGKGEMPKIEKDKLIEIVKSAHENGCLLRFWGTMDRPGKYREAVWTELKNAGVDLIGTDDINGLKEFLIKQ